MVTYESIFEAYFDCRHNKRNTANALEYEVCFEDVLIRLTDSINAKSYTRQEALRLSLRDRDTERSSPPISLTVCCTTG